MVWTCLLDLDQIAQMLLVRSSVRKSRSILY